MRKHQWVPVHKHTNPTDGGALVRPDVDGGGSVGSSSSGGGSSPTGLAGGDLSGTYPDPQVVDDSHNHTASTLPASVATLGPLLISSTPSNPIVFADVILTSDGTDFLYGS